MKKLHGAIQQALATPDVQKRMEQVGGVVTPGSIEMFANLMRSERQRYDKLIQATGIKP
ncbi:MAG: hypothetical protein ACO1OY_09105 [Ramlibacter sp.]